ncbi:NUDIX domain-containing protein [Deinococcus cavernae]|uniref:NUDIX domain-containing protein n=1 Tax=Deinococcus cavernae TaxID=2320857 RepID=A0A418V6V1_9DEIO|nr:NUDIX domain-containing protein [Deinococcus cavernae]RJF71843.1 NUDIX domain-containing protein [Deinococcus cavernae]
MTLRPRAVGILFNSKNQVLLMLRRKNGKAYATLPGGGIEEGETPAEACAREVLEEVNLIVEVGPEVLVLDNLQNHEHYFLTRLVSGEMRLGDGPEGTIRQSGQNWYQPEWVSLEKLEEVNLVPEQARGLVRGLNDQSKSKEGNQ